jgi:2-methylisocitrate lyase-like PEP mutase family enzyme
MTEVRARLREMVSEGSGLLAPGVFDGLSAALTAEAGFRAAYLTGAGVAAVLGVPDIGLTTQTEMARQVELVASVVDVPVIADADTGFGDIANTYRTVRAYERAGAAAIQLEDQDFPKKCGHLDDKRVIDAEEFALKIQAAAEARRDPDTVLIARTDARAGLGFEEAVRRVNLYADAGADMVFLETPQSVDEVRRIPTLVAAPAVFNLVPGGKTPAMEVAELAELGYALVIVPGLTLLSAISAMRTALRQAIHGDVGAAAGSPHDVFDAVGLPFWQDLDRRYDREDSHA